MARKLTKAQKKILDAQPSTVTSCSEMAYDDYASLVALNDYETLWQDAERYLWDNTMNERYS